MLGWLSGRGAQKRTDGPKNAIVALRLQLEMLQKRERHLESQMAEQDAIARKHLATNKTGESTANLVISRSTNPPFRALGWAGLGEFEGITDGSRICSCQSRT